MWSLLERIQAICPIPNNHQSRGKSYSTTVHWLYFKIFQIPVHEFYAKSVEERLFENVEQGNIEDVQALIYSDVDLNLKNNENETLFEIATRLKNVYENISQIVLNQMEDNVIKHLAEKRSCLGYIIGMSLGHCPVHNGLGPNH